LLLFIYSKSVKYLIEGDETSINKLNKWFTCNKVSLSINKTCYSMFGVTNHDKNNTTIHIGDTELNQVESKRYLGIFIDSNLNWEIHINYIYRKLIKFTSIFYKIRIDYH